MKGIAEIMLVLLWLAGAILANGFWSTTLAIFFPFWALYLVVERLMQSIGWA